MSHSNARLVHDLLRQFSARDKLVALVVSVIHDHRSETLKSAMSLIATVGALAHHLSDCDKIALSEVLRDCADTIEHRQEEHV
jgi:hypothetical protein